MTPRWIADVGALLLVSGGTFLVAFSITALVLGGGDANIAIALGGGLVGIGSGLATLGRRR